MSDTKFIDGLIVKRPSDKAPEFVKFCLSFKRAELIAWLQAQQGDWINADVNESRDGKLYAKVNERKPRTDGQNMAADKAKQDVAKATGGGRDEDEIPFAPRGKRNHWE